MFLQRKTHSGWFYSVAGGLSEQFLSHQPAVAAQKNTTGTAVLASPELKKLICFKLLFIHDFEKFGNLADSIN
jgi:hypothetical protein